MRILFNRFAHGKPKAVTLSYDDGTVHDRRLVEILDRHGVRGSFHLNSGFLDADGRLGAAEVAALFRNHEVSVHTVSHPHLEDLPPDLIAREIIDDRRNLEALVGYPVRGMSYPFGTHSPKVVAMLPSLGIECARTTVSHGTFRLPENLLTWPATCHHKNRLLELTAEFLKLEPPRKMALLYVWGHSYEFDREGNWGLIEEFCRMVGGQEGVWHATNIEIADYIKALGALRFSAAGDAVYNPSAVSVWVSADGKPMEIPAGKTVKW